jgi:hypothetical protein
MFREVVLKDYLYLSFRKMKDLQNKLNRDLTKASPESEEYKITKKKLGLINYALICSIRK